jgi:hypothetical protein
MRCLLCKLAKGKAVVFRQHTVSLHQQIAGLQGFAAFLDLDDLLLLVHLYHNDRPVDRSDNLEAFSVVPLGQHMNMWTPTMLSDGEAAVWN